MEAVDVERVLLQTCKTAPFLTFGIFDKYSVVSLFSKCSLVPKGHILPNCF